MFRADGAAVIGIAAAANQGTAGGAMNEGIVVATAGDIVKEVASGNGRRLFIHLDKEYAQRSLNFDHSACYAGCRKNAQWKCKNHSE